MPIKTQWSLHHHGHSHWNNEAKSWINENTASLNLLMHEMRILTSCDPSHDNFSAKALAWIMTKNEQPMFPRRPLLLETWE